MAGTTKNTIMLGDSWQLVKQLDDDSVDCVVTSPPYWGLRDYGVEGQAGVTDWQTIKDIESGKQKTL